LVPVDGAAVAAAAAAAVAAVESDPRNEVEEQGDEFAAYCRRGRGRSRVEMEDRHVAKVALGGDPEVVSSIQLAFSVMDLFARFFPNEITIV
jgi:protein phosphatase 1L